VAEGVHTGGIVGDLAAVCVLQAFRYDDQIRPSLDIAVMMRSS